MNKQIIPLAIFTIAFAVGMCWFCWHVSNTLSKPNRPEIPNSSIVQYKDSIETFVYKSLDSVIKENFNLKEDAILKTKYITKTIYLNENKKKLYLNSVDSTKLYVSDSILRANGVRK